MEKCKNAYLNVKEDYQDLKYCNLYLIDENPSDLDNLFEVINWDFIVLIRLIKRLIEKEHNEV